MASEISVLIESAKVSILTPTLTSTLLKNAFKLAKYRRETTENPQQALIIFSTSDEQFDFYKYQAILSSIDGVLEVTKSGGYNSKIQANTSPKIPQMDEVYQLAESIAKVFPDIVGPVMEFDSSLHPTSRTTQLYRLGQTTGQLIFASKFKNYQIKGSLHTALSKLALPILKQISIAELKQTKIILALSPFALYHHSNKPQCDFITGLIDGLLNSPSDAINVRARETCCQARGDNNCIFEVLPI